METVVKICADCAADGDWLTDALAIFGAATGVVSLAIAALTLLFERRDHDALLLREEFSGHRVPIEAALLQLRRQLKVLRLSAPPEMPIARVRQNFEERREATLTAAAELIEELGQLEERNLFRGVRWQSDVAALYFAFEDAWERITDDTLTEPEHRSAVTQVVANAEGMCSRTRTKIERAIRVPLTDGRWPSFRAKT